MPDELTDVSGEAGENVTEVETQAADESVEQQPASEPARSYVEVDDPDNHYVRVKVDGQEIEVPFREALEGYSRHSDYSRKTAELAQQRQAADYALRIQQALQADPRATLQFLASQYIKEQPAAPEVPEFDDPLERQVWEMQQRYQALESQIAQRDADAQLDAAIGGLRQQFSANDDDVREVVQVAYQNGLGVDAFPMIFKTIQFDRLQARVQATRAQQAAQQAETARRQAAAAQANQLVTNGSGAPGTGMTNRLNADTGNMSFQEAIEAAFAEHGDPPS